MLAYAAHNGMGKKARLKALRKKIDKELGSDYQMDVDAKKQLDQLIDDPDYEMVFMDMGIPLYVFINEKKGGMAALGEPVAVRGAKALFADAMARTIADFDGKPSLN